MSRVSASAESDVVAGGVGGLLVAGRVGLRSGSRWSARSEARTNDLDAGEDRRMLVPPSREALVAVVDVSDLLQFPIVVGCSSP